VEDRSDATIIGLVLGSAACVLAAPVIGRLGAPLLADVAMWVAAGCGVAAFGVAGAATVRAALRDGDRRTKEKGR
jgi:hypothetical protein